MLPPPLPASTHFFFSVVQSLEGILSDLFYDHLLFFFFFNIFFFWLCWVTITVRGLSLVVANGGYCSLQCAGFSLWWPLVAEHGL